MSKVERKGGKKRKTTEGMKCHLTEVFLSKPDEEGDAKSWATPPYLGHWASSWLEHYHFDLWHAFNVSLVDFRVLQRWCWRALDRLMADIYVFRERRQIDYAASAEDPFDQRGRRAGLSLKEQK